MTGFSIRIESWLSFDESSRHELDAELAIRCGTATLTTVSDFNSRSTRDRVYLSSYRLAKWFLINWWRIRYESTPPYRDFPWRFAHECGSIGGGYIWPPITFTSDGETQFVQAQASQNDFASLRYIRPLSRTVLDSDAFEEGIDDFITAVIARARDIGQASDLEKVYRALLTERMTPAFARFRRREAMLGFDPDAIPDDVVGVLEQADSVAGPDATDEVAVALSKPVSKSNDRALIHQIGALLDSIAGQQTAAPTMSAPVFAGSDSDDRFWFARTPYQRGYEAARHVRAELKLETQLTDQRFIHAFGGGHDFITAPVSLVGRVGIAERQGHDRILPFFTKRRVEQRRFEAARMLADHMFVPTGDGFRPVTDLRTARQKFQRAFAAELLCPMKALHEFTHEANGVRDVSDATEYFGVSADVVRWQARNWARLQGDAVPLAAFASDFDPAD